MGSSNLMSPKATIMQLTSVNIGVPRPFSTGKYSYSSGIYKIPTTDPVKIGSLGLESDFIGDKRHHGGEDQAIYLYGQEDYDWWSEQRQQQIAPGTFGENLTVVGWDSKATKIGDRFRIGEVLLEVTSPRIPCATLSRRMDDKEFVSAFIEAELPGAYCRVLQEGMVQTGMSISYEPCPTDSVGLLEVMRDYYKPELTETAIRRFLAAPIASRYRTHKEEQLTTIIG